MLHDFILERRASSFQSEEDAVEEGALASSVVEVEEDIWTVDRPRDGRENVWETSDFDPGTVVEECELPVVEDDVACTTRDGEREKLEDKYWLEDKKAKAEYFTRVPRFGIRNLSL